jgi:hypothetical protein
MIRQFFALLLCGLAMIPADAAVYEGRVETVEQGSQPQFPAEVLKGGATFGEKLPSELIGSWYGKVEVAQLEMYQPSTPYGAAFVAEVQKLFRLGQTGQVLLLFKKNKAGEVSLLSSDVILKGGMKLQMTAGKGPAAVPGGYNLPHTVRDYVRTQPEKHSIDQTRIDEVDIVDGTGKRIQHGYTEISAQYSLISPKRMSLKLLEIDYDDEHKPLWKILIRGTASR